MTTYIKANTNSGLVVTTTGDDANGGGWGGQQSGNGVNRALDDDAHVVIDGSTVQCEAVSRSVVEFTSGYEVSLDDCGNGGWFNIASGTKAGTYAWGPITSVDTGNNRWTISNLHSPWNGISAGEALTGRMGGALASLGEATNRTSSYSVVWVQAGTYTLANNVHSSSGGPPEIPAYSQMLAFKTSLGDGMAHPDDRAIVEAGTTTDNGYLFKMGGSRSGLMAGFDIRCEDEWTGGTNFYTVINTIVRDAAGHGFNNRNSYNCAAYDCSNSGGTAYGFYNTSGMCVECLAQDCDNGFNLQSGTRNLAHGGGTGTGFSIRDYNGIFGCFADGFATGFSASSKGASAYNLASNCTTGGTGQVYTLLAYNNTTNVSGTPPNGGYAANPALQLTADPYEDRTGTPPDYRINDTAGGGAELENYRPKWAAGTIASPQEQFAAILKSSGGGSSVIPARPIQIGA